MVEPNAPVHSLEEQTAAIQPDTARLQQTEATPAGGGAEPRESGLAASAHPREEAGEGVRDTLERPATRVDGIGTVTVRIIGPDDGEALLLIETCDGLAAKPPCVAPLL